MALVDPKEDLEHVAHELRPALIIFALRLLHHREDAEDAVHAGLTRALAALDKGPFPDNLKAWLYKIVFREAQSIRAKRRPLTGVNLCDVESVLPSAPPKAWTVEERRVFQEVLLRFTGELPAPYAEIVLLRFCQDFSLSETAETLGLPLGTVKSYQSRALKSLHERVKPILDRWI